MDSKQQKTKLSSTSTISFRKVISVFVGITVLVHVVLLIGQNGGRRSTDFYNWTSRTARRNLMISARKASTEINPISSEQPSSLLTSQKTADIAPPKGELPVYYDPEIRLVPGSNRSDPQFRTDDSRVYLHDAYYKPNEPNQISLTVLAFPNDLVDKGRWPYVHYCAYYDANGTFLDQQLARVLPTLYTGSLFICKLDKQRLPLGSTLIPAFVFVYRDWSHEGLINPSLTNPPWLKRIRYNAREADKNGMHGQVALCMKVIHHRPNILLFLQFLEYYRIKGVDRMFLKVPEALDNEFEQIIHHYSVTGRMKFDIMKWTGVIPSFCHQDNFFCEMEQPVDCTFRTAFLYNYTLVLDYDELIRGQSLNDSIIETVEKLAETKNGSLLRPNDAPAAELVEQRKQCGSFEFLGQYRLDVPELRPDLRPVPWSELMGAAAEVQQLNITASSEIENNIEAPELLVKSFSSNDENSIMSLQQTESNRTTATLSLSELVTSQLPWLQYRSVSKGFTPLRSWTKSICRPEQARRQFVHFVQEFVDPSRWMFCHASDPTANGWMYHFKTVSTKWPMYPIMLKQYPNLNHQLRNLTDEEMEWGLLLAKNIVQVIQDIHHQPLDKQPKQYN